MIRLLPALFCLLPGLALADGFDRLTDRERFLALVGGHELALPLLGVALTVQPGGQIEGAAMGAPITGQWTWKEGLFCRSMQWSGTGRSATFVLR
jgi:hypothetical protein